MFSGGYQILPDKYIEILSREPGEYNVDNAYHEMKAMIKKPIVGYFNGGVLRFNGLRMVVKDDVNDVDQVVITVTDPVFADTTHIRSDRKAPNIVILERS